MSAAIQKSSKDKSDQRYFFRLPAELRIIIYEYVLHYEHGLTVEYDPHEHHLALCHDKKASSSKAILANPLSLVCRQMELETHGILTKANSEINILCTGFSTPSSYILNHFMRNMSKTAMRRLRKVTITGAKDVNTQNLSWESASSYFESFKPFCLANPDTRVVLRFGLVGDTSERIWLTTCLSISEAISNMRSGRLNGALRARDLWVDAFFDRIGMETACILRDLPPNLRFSLLAEFPEEEVARQIKESKTFLKLKKGDIELARWLWDEGM